MREVPILVWISVLIVGGIGIWLATGASLPFSGAQPAVVQPANGAQLDDAQTDAAKKVETAKLVKKPAAKTAQTPPPAAPAQEPVVVAQAAEVVIAPPVPAPAPKRFPSASEVPVGAERENIAERFGEPSLATTATSDHGRVRETLIYSRKSGRDVTVINIEDGKVLSAYSR
jgi:hypothetical protein